MGARLATVVVWNGPIKNIQIVIIHEYVIQITM
jgi:hypothetical protein